jgi:hypothetical protein
MESVSGCGVMMAMTLISEDVIVDLLLLPKEGNEEIGMRLGGNKSCRSSVFGKLKTLHLFKCHSYSCSSKLGGDFPLTRAGASLRRGFHFAILQCIVISLTTHVEIKYLGTIPNAENADLLHQLRYQMNAASRSCKHVEQTTRPSTDPPLCRWLCARRCNCDSRKRHNLKLGVKDTEGRVGSASMT